MPKKVRKRPKKTKVLYAAHTDFDDEDSDDYEHYDAAAHVSHPAIIAKAIKNEAHKTRAKITREDFLDYLLGNSKKHKHSRLLATKGKLDLGGMSISKEELPDLSIGLGFLSQKDLANSKISKI